MGYILTQHAQILHWFKIHPNQGMTMMDAFKDLQITKLNTRCGELIMKGYRFDKVWEKNEDTGTRYIRYFLKSCPEKKSEQ